MCNRVRGAGAVAFQNGDGFTSAGPLRLGEIIHVWAVGLVPVTPRACSRHFRTIGEALARLASPLIWLGADVLA